MAEEKRSDSSAEKHLEVNASMEKSVRPKSSKVWEHFTLKTSKKTVSCKMCSMDLAWHGRTTLLREHLQRRHVGAVDDGKNSRKKQGSIRDLVQRKVCTPQQAAALTDATLNMLATDMRPLSMVKDESFRQMIHILNPGYTLPSRTHFTKLMERKYEQTFHVV
ncbi:zinc finger BED domain-containing protein 4-like [Nerophis ophidion]|uniref:zinc finger BED domain-containing protein 4-like n=1 Tax=Nerophis ophidion TaxID=159077 RepID=UPI002ADF1CA6|nr:zinc finger BED domain-containing protein 4-like isoform X2 [Nerophis ophidion]XP_061734381.1 zinc finger BED domain-containing protein 4-like [Nerophis ophidion]